MRLARIIFAALVLLVLSGTALPASAQDLIAVKRAKVSYEIDKGVSAEDEAEIRQGIRLAQDYFMETFGIDVLEPVARRAAEH